MLHTGAPKCGWGVGKVATSTEFWRFLLIAHKCYAYMYVIFIWWLPPALQIDPTI